MSRYRYDCATGIVDDGAPQRGGSRSKYSRYDWKREHRYRRDTAPASWNFPSRWSYDGRGNLTSATRHGTTKSYSYASGNPEEVTSTSISGQPTTYYAYDGPEL